MDVTVAIATFGERSWLDLAASRAVVSAEQLGVPWVYAHGSSLHRARNAALELVDTEWVCHLDADDELEPGYFDAMAAGSADVRAPAVRYGSDDAWAEPTMPRVVGHRHNCDAECLVEGNWIVVGAVARTDLVRDLGWRDFPWCEDWDLWLRCHLAGDTIEAIPAAVYRAHVRADSRNRGATDAEKRAAFDAIARANGVAA